MGKSYIGVNGIAKKISKIYVGVENVAKKVKKGYVGVGGVAKLFFNINKKFEVLGTVGSSNYTSYGHSIASTPSYFIVAGGKINATGLLQTDIAEAWDTDFIKTTTTAITGRFYHKAGSVGEHAVFLGGFATASGWSYGSCSNIVEAYDDNLTKKSCSNLSAVGYNTPTAFNSQHLMTFGNGQYSAVSDSVDSYDVDLIKTQCAALSTARKLSASTRVGEYLINAGGSSSTSASGGCVAYVEAYSNELIKTNCANIDTAVTQPEGSWVNGYAMIIGGNQASESGTPINDINIYDEDLTKRQSLTFPVSTSLSLTTTISDGKYAIIGAGRTGSSNSWSYPGTYYVYDEDLVLIETLENVGFTSDVGKSTVSATIGDVACMIRYNTADLLKSIVYR